jgi:hypothetical protein
VFPVGGLDHAVILVQIVWIFDGLGSRQRSDEASAHRASGECDDAAKPATVWHSVH